MCPPAPQRIPRAVPLDTSRITNGLPYLASNPISPLSSPWLTPLHSRTVADPEVTFYETLVVTPNVQGFGVGRECGIGSKKAVPRRVGNMHKLPKVQKGFEPVAKTDRLREQTIRTVTGALLTAGLALGVPVASSASVAPEGPPTVQVQSGRVMVLTPPPAITISDGRTQTAQHSSHFSHSSHASHASHCSGYSYCG